MKKRIFWVLSLAFLTILSGNIEMTAPLRIALVANTIVVLIDIAVTVHKWCIEDERK